MALQIDAALEGYGKYDDKAYFFASGQYVRYDWKADRAEAGYPASLSLWKLPLDRVDAALSGKGEYEGKAYFFRGNQYARYDWDNDKGDLPLQPTSKWKLPSDMPDSFDAAINGQEAYEGKAYFFAGDKYARYDWKNDSGDADYPQPLSAWNLGFDRVDCAINGAGPFEGKAYFFRKDKYVRYDWKADKPDAPPRDIKLWNGLLELLEVGVAREVALSWIAGMEQRIEKATLGGLGGPDLALFEVALNTHFHTDIPGLGAHGPNIIATYGKVRDALSRIGDVVRFRTDAEAKSDNGLAPDGVPHPMYTFFNSSINATTTFRGFGPKCQAAMVLHEPVHFVDSGADGRHDIYEHSPGYASVTATDAEHNPSSYVCFAQHLFLGSDERFGAGRPSE